MVWWPPSMHAMSNPQPWAPQRPYDPTTPPPPAWVDGSPVPDDRSPKGRASMILSIIAVALALVLSCVTIFAAQQIANQSAYFPVQNMEQWHQLPAGVQHTIILLEASLLAQIIPAILGVISFILAIVSFNRESRHGNAIAGIILAVGGPTIVALILEAFAGVITRR